MLPKELLTLLEGKDDDENRKELEITLLTLLRFMPIEEVDNFMTRVGKPDFPLSLELKRKLQQSYEQARRKFFTAASYFSRYSSPDDLANLKLSYYNELPRVISLKDTCQSDMAYGEEREGLATVLLGKLEKLKSKTFVPEEFQFSALPASSKGTKRAAALMEKIAEWSYVYQGQNEQKNTERFKKLRSMKSSREFCTPMGGRYAWGRNLTEAVIQYSNSINMEIINRDEGTYLLTYPTDSGNLVVTRVECVGSRLLWGHGKAPLSSTWVAIEDLFEEIWAMNLREAGKEKMREFYSAVAELVWLIGNSQPMERGSGSVAEIMMAVLHRHHKLNPPILKLGFPQLDVLDISFPLDDYKYMFPYFFEPRTLPPSLQLDPLEPCESMVDELEEIYRKKNSDPVSALALASEKRCDEIRNLVCDELVKEIARLDENKKKPLSERDEKRRKVLLQLQDDLMKIKVDYSKTDCIATYTKSFERIIGESLVKPHLDKYRGLHKLGKRLCNALLVLTFPLSAPVKWWRTGSVLFSTEGKSKEAVHTAHKILKNISVKKQ